MEYKIGEKPYKLMCGRIAFGGTETGYMNCD